MPHRATREVTAPDHLKGCPVARITAISRNIGVSEERTIAEDSDDRNADHTGGDAEVAVATGVAVEALTDEVRGPHVHPAAQNGFGLRSKKLALQDASTFSSRGFHVPRLVK